MTERDKLIEARDKAHKERDMRKDVELMQFDTFRGVGSYEKSNMLQQEPSCWNGNVRVRKYRITVELIDEPEEVIQARIQKLWDECTNHYNWAAIKSAAALEGVNVDFSFDRQKGKEGF